MTSDGQALGRPPAAGRAPSRRPQLALALPPLDDLEVEPEPPFRRIAVAERSQFLGVCLHPPGVEKEHARLLERRTPRSTEQRVGEVAAFSRRQGVEQDQHRRIG